MKMKQIIHTLISSSSPRVAGLQPVAARTSGTLVPVVLRRKVSSQPHVTLDNDLFRNGF